MAFCAVTIFRNESIAKNISDQASVKSPYSVYRYYLSLKKFRVNAALTQWWPINNTWAAVPEQHCKIFIDIALNCHNLCCVPV